MDHLLSAESVIAEEGSFFFFCLGGGMAAMVHRLQASFMDTLAPFLTSALSFPIHILLYFFIALSCFQLRAIAVIPSLFASEG